MSDFDTLARRLQPHYSRFDVANRLLFSGHSHQAWPDVAREGQLEGFDTAAGLVDDKWSATFGKTEKLRSYLRKFYDDPEGRYCLATNTHELVIKWLSALDLPATQRLVITDHEFYTLFRQTRRLQEEGIEIEEVPALPPDGFARRIEQALRKPASAVMISRIYFENALINPEIPEVAEICRAHNTPLLIDDYHGTNVVPISLRRNNLEDTYLLIGGYKYLQWGEGNCFLRYPKDCALRPVITGWFASFSSLQQPREHYSVQYEDDHRFGSATYDPVSQFRAARVVDFFREQQLTPEVLRRQYEAQIQEMHQRFLEMDADPDIIKLQHGHPLSHNAGFLAFQSPHTPELYEKLKENGVFCDCRGQILRLGPAPYIGRDHIDELFNILNKCLKQITRT